MPTAIKAPASWLTDGATRLDASFYVGDGQKQAREFIHSKLKKLPLSSLALGGQEGIFIPSRFKRIYVENSDCGFPYITGSGMTQANPLLNCRYISRKHTKSAKRIALERGMLVITCSGNIGNVVFLSSFLEGAVGSPDLIRVIADPYRIPPGFLYAFLASKIGKALITQHTYGSVIQHIEAHHLYDLPVPILPERVMNEAHDMVTRAADLMTKANQTLRDLVETIEQQYSPPATNSKRELAFAVSSKRLFEADKYTDEKRLEADFYLPEYERIRSYIADNCDSAFLGDLTESITRSGLRARVFVSNGIPMYTGQNLEMLRPSYEKQLSRKLTRNIERDITQDGDIIISCAGTVGKTELCHRNFYTGIFASDKLIRVRPKPERIHPGFVFAFLKSALGRKQILKHKTGSVIEWIRENHLSSIQFPVPKDKGVLIGRKACAVCEQRQEAFELEQEAIALVERMIENQK